MEGQSFGDGGVKRDADWWRSINEPKRNLIFKIHATIFSFHFSKIPGLIITDEKSEKTQLELRCIMGRNIRSKKSSRGLSAIRDDGTVRTERGIRGHEDRHRILSLLNSV